MNTRAGYGYCKRPLKFKVDLTFDD